MDYRFLQIKMEFSPKRNEMKKFDKFDVCFMGNGEYHEENENIITCVISVS